MEWLAFMICESQRLMYGIFLLCYSVQHRVRGHQTNPAIIVFAFWMRNTEICKRSSGWCKNNIWKNMSNNSVYKCFRAMENVLMFIFIMLSRHYVSWIWYWISAYCNKPGWLLLIEMGDFTENCADYGPSTDKRISLGMALNGGGIKEPFLHFTEGFIAIMVY